MMYGLVKEGGPDSLGSGYRLSDWGFAQTGRRASTRCSGRYPMET